MLASFCLFSSFPIDTVQMLIDKSIDGVLRTRTSGGRMEGAFESTELRQASDLQNLPVSVNVGRTN